MNPIKSNIFEAQNFISTKSQLLTIERNYRYLPQNKLCEYLHNYDHRVTVNNCMIELVSDCLTEKIEVPGTPVTAPQLLIEDGNMIIYMNWNIRNQVNNSDLCYIMYSLYFQNENTIFKHIQLKY